MNKVYNNVVRMIELIKQNNGITISELAEKIEVSESTIKRYKEKAEDLGINIKGVIGRKGGYSIN